MISPDGGGSPAAVAAARGDPVPPQAAAAAATICAAAPSSDHPPTDERRSTSFGLNRLINIGASTSSSISTGHCACGVHFDTSSLSVCASGTSTTCLATGTRARSCIEDSPSCKNQGNSPAAGCTWAPTPPGTASTPTAANRIMFIQTAYPRRVPVRFRE